MRWQDLEESSSVEDRRGMGGMIILDAKGNFAFPMNSLGMYRGTIGKDGVPMTAIFADEELKNIDVKKLRESK